jgi:hypothetical protein
MGLFDSMLVKEKKPLEELHEPKEPVNEQSVLQSPVKKPVNPPEEEPEPTVDLTILAKAGAKMEISEYMDSDQLVEISIIPYNDCSGSVRIKYNVSADETEPDIKEIAHVQYMQEDASSLETAIKCAVKTAKEYIDNHKQAFEDLVQFLTDNQDTIFD